MAEIIVLRIVHVVGGMFWVGSGLFNIIYLFPALAAAGPAAGPVMSSFQTRRLFTVMPVVALLTILAGLRLMWITSDGFAAPYFSTGSGMTYATSGVMAILAFVLGVFVSRPVAARMGVLRQSIASAGDAAARGRLAAEMEGLQRRSLIVGRIVAWLLLLTAVGMAIGRYMN